MSDQGGSNAQVVAMLERLLERVERLESRVEQFLGMANEAKQVAAIAADTMDETVAQLGKEGVDIQQRAMQGAALLKTMTEEKTLRTLDRLVKHIGDLEPAVEMLGQLPGMLAMAGDIFDETVQDLAKKGIDVEKVARNFAYGMQKTALLMGTEPFEILMNSAILEPSTLRVVSLMGESMGKAQNNPQPVGLFGLLGALGDPEVKRAVGFLIEMARHLGKHLPDASAIKTLQPASHPH